MTAAGYDSVTLTQPPLQVKTGTRGRTSAN
jgi:hypothetical protein